MKAYISIIPILLIFLGFSYPNSAHSACSDFHGNETACNNLEDDDNCVYLDLGGAANSCHSCDTNPGAGDSRSASQIFDEAAGDVYKLIGDSLRNNLITNNGMIWCHNVDRPMVAGDSTMIEDSNRTDWDLNDFVSNNYYQPIWLSNLSGQSILLGLSSAILPISLSGKHNVDLRVRLGKGTVVIDQDDLNPQNLSSTTTVNLISDIHSLVPGMSALNTDESNAIETSDFGISFTYAASFSKSEFVDFVTNNAVPSGLILKSSSAISEWSLSDQIVLRNNTENFDNSSEAAQSGALAQLAGGIVSGTQSIIADGTALRVKSDFGLEEIFEESVNAVAVETDNNSNGRTDINSLISDFSSSFNSRQTERKELRKEQRSAEAQGKKCSEVASCVNKKVALSNSEKSYSRSVNAKNSEGDFSFKQEQVYLGTIGSGTVDSSGDLVFQINGGAALKDAESFYTKKNNGQLNGNKNRQISLETTFRAIGDGDKINSSVSSNQGVIDTTAPTIISRSPTDLETNVSINTPIRITFSEPIKFSNAPNKWAKAYEINNPGGYALYHQWNAPRVDNMRIIDGYDENLGRIVANNTLVIFPRKNYNSNKEYFITLKPDMIQDMAGNPNAQLGNWAYRFTVGTSAMNSATCEDGVKVTNASYRSGFLAGGASAGTTSTVICDTGYEGGGTWVCKENGLWQGNGCFPQNCNSTTVANSSDVIPNGYYQDTYSVTCNESFEGGGLYSCGANGSWIGTGCTLSSAVCPGQGDSNQIQLGNKIVEVRNTGGIYEGSCNSIQDYEPQVSVVELSCVNGIIQVPDTTFCDDFDEINFDCRNFNSGWDFVVKQTNLSHFTYNSETLEFEKINDLPSNLVSSVGNSVSDGTILENPWGMAYASCDYFSSISGTSEGDYIVDITDDICLWENPNHYSCYGKYRIDINNDDFFFHPTYHGPYTENPGYRGDLSFYQETDPQSNPVTLESFSVGIHTLTDNLDGVEDNWYTYQISPFTSYNLGYNFSYNIRRNFIIPYDRNKKFDDVFKPLSSPSLTMDITEQMRADFRSRYKKANDFVECAQRDRDPRDPFDTYKTCLGYEAFHSSGNQNQMKLYNYNSLKRDYLGRGTSALIRDDYNELERFVDRKGLCQSGSGDTAITGCKNLIITDFQTCQNMTVIPDDTEVSCFPKQLEIVHDPINNYNTRTSELNLFTINGYENVVVKNLAIKVQQGTSLSQVWKVSRILDSLEFDQNQNSFFCTNDIDEGTDCLNANELCTNLGIEECKDLIAREFLISFVTRTPHEVSSFARYLDENGQMVDATDGETTVKYNQYGFYDYKAQYADTYAGSDFEQVITNNITSYKDAIFGTGSTDGTHPYKCGGSDLENDCNASDLTPNVSKFERRNLINLIPILRLWDNNNNLGWYPPHWERGNNMRLPAEFIFRGLENELSEGKILCGKDFVQDINSTDDAIITYGIGGDENATTRLFQLMEHCPDQVYYTVLRSIAQQYVPFENMASINTVFKFYDNYNVKFSNVIIQSSGFDGILYGESNRFVQFHGVKLQGINFRTFEDFHVPVRDPDNGLKRFLENIPGHLSRNFPGKTLATTSLMANGIRIDNARDDDGGGIEFPNSWRRDHELYAPHGTEEQKAAMKVGNDNLIFPKNFYHSCQKRGGDDFLNIILSETDYVVPYAPDPTDYETLSGNPDCSADDFLFLGDSPHDSNVENYLTDSQLLSPFYEPTIGPEDHINTTNFNYFDAKYLLSDVQFPHRQACYYLEARARAEDAGVGPSSIEPSSSDQYNANLWKGSNSNHGYSLKSCTHNKDCVGSNSLNGAVCLGGFCRSNKCDTKYVSITNTTVQNGTWNPLDVDTKISNDGAAWKNSNWGQQARNDDGIHLRSTAGLIFNSEVINLTTDTLIDVQHRDGGSRDPESFDHVRISRNIFANGRMKTTSKGAPEDTMTMDNNILVNTTIGGYHQDWRYFFINNSIVDPKKVIEGCGVSETFLEDCPYSYKEFTEKIFRLEAEAAINANIPFSGQRNAIFNNSLISSNTDGWGSLFLIGSAYEDNDPANRPPGYNITSSGNNFLLSKDFNIIRFRKVPVSAELENFYGNDSDEFKDRAEMNASYRLTPFFPAHTAYHHQTYNSSYDPVSETYTNSYVEANVGVNTSLLDELITVDPSDPNPDGYLDGYSPNRVTFVKEFCYKKALTEYDDFSEPIAEMFKRKVTGNYPGFKGDGTTPIVFGDGDYFAQHWPYSRDHFYQCYMGGYDNNLEDIESDLDWFRQIHQTDIDTPEEILSLSDPFVNEFTKRGPSDSDRPTTYQKCSTTNNVISSKIREHKASSFTTMGKRYRVHRDFYGNNRKVRTTAGAFEDLELDSNGCRQ